MTEARKAKAVPPPSDETAYRLEDQVGYLIRRAHQRASAIFQALIGDAQITPTQYSTLVKLHDLGELSQNHLGRLTAMDPATTQGVIRRLQERELIANRPDPNDRRRTLLRLTPGGQTLVEALLVNGPKVTASTLAPLSPAEQGVFLSLLKRLV